MTGRHENVTKRTFQDASLRYISLERGPRGHYQASIRRSYGPKFVEEAVDCYARLLTAYGSGNRSGSFIPHQPLGLDDPDTGFGIDEHEFFHSLGLSDSELVALEKELEQAYHSGNREWAWRARHRLVEHLMGYCRAASPERNSKET